MFRLLGAVLVLLGCVGFALCLCREMRRRLYLLYEMKRMYELFRSQIGYSAAAFPELCRMSSQHLEEPFSSFLYAVYERAEENSGKAYQQIWKEEAEHFLEGAGMKKEDKILLFEFSRSVGYADKELMEQEVENRIKAVLLVIQDMEKHLAEREKMIVSFGIMGGLLIVILLL